MLKWNDDWDQIKHWADMNYFRNSNSFYVANDFNGSKKITNVLLVLRAEVLKNTCTGIAMNNVICSINMPFHKDW